MAADEIPLGEPTAQGADRTLSLQPLAQIEGGDPSAYFLKSPSHPIWLGGGKLLAFTDQAQLLIFDEKGKFQRNLQKSGEGPGEWQMTYSLSTDQDRLVVFAYMPGKCMFFDTGFNLIREIRYDKPQSMMRPLTATAEKGRFFSVNIDFAKIKTGTSPFVNRLKEFDAEGRVTDRELSFSHRVHSSVVKAKQSVQVMMTFVDPFHYAAIPGKNKALVVCSNDYRLELVDLERQSKKTLVRRVKKTPWRKDPEDFRSEDAPKPEFFNDVSAIVTRGDQFWVFGADMDERQSVTVDVIDCEGRHLDRFRLSLPGLDHPRRLERSPIALTADKIAWIHLDEDENPLLSIFSYTL